MKECNSRKVVVGAALMVVLLTVGVLAEPGQGIQVGQVKIRPFVDLSGTYDSNVYQTDKSTSDDLYFDGTVGLNVGLNSADIDLNALGFLGTRNYADETDLDFGYGGEALKLRYGTRDRLVIEAGQGFRRVEDIDRYGSELAVAGVSPDSVLDVSSRNNRDINQVALSAGRNLTDKLGLDLGYRFDAVNYDSAALRDISGHYGQAETAYRITDKSATFATLKYGRQNGTGADGSADYASGRLGFKTVQTVKLSFKGGVGIQQFDPEAGEDKTAFNYDVAATWQATDKTTLQAGGRNGISKSILADNQGVQDSVIWLGLVNRMATSTAVSLAAAYRQDDYLDTDRTDNGLGARARVDYTIPASFLRTYLEVSYDTVDSNVADYNETRASLGVNLTY